MSRNEVVSAIKNAQGITPIELAKMMNTTPSLISYHIKQLSEKKVVFHIWDCGKKRLFVRTFYGDDRNCID